MIHILTDGKNIFNNGKFSPKLEETVEDTNFFVENIPLNTDLTTEAFSLLRQAMKARCHSSFTTYSQI